MKFFLSLLAMLFVVQSLHAQFLPMTGSPGNYYYNGGSITIGPDYDNHNKFYVGGSGGVVNFSNMEDSDLGFLISDPFAADKYAMITPSTPTNLAFGVSSIERMRITNAGLIGIGTTTPSSMLSLGASAGNKKFFIYDNGTEGSGLGRGSAEFRIFGGATGTNHISMGKYDLSSDTFYEQMRISNGGNVGIGTNNPLFRLHIAGGLVVGGNGNGNLDPVNPSSNLSFLANSGLMVIGWNRTAGAGETDFISNQGGGGTGGFAYYNYSNSGAQSLLMYLRGNGQLTIGDCNPYSYKLAVGGSMIAESVTIKTLANWPDYVFKPGYNLPSLSEVNTYIGQNQHLPEMPSEANVAKNGMNLGEMNVLLVKKVEELTLYLIKKDEEDKGKDARIDKLQKQVDQLIKMVQKN